MISEYITTVMRERSDNDQYATLRNVFSEDLNEEAFEVSLLTEELRQLRNHNELKIGKRVRKNWLVTHYGESLLFSH